MLKPAYNFMPLIKIKISSFRFSGYSSIIKQRKLERYSSSNFLGSSAHVVQCCPFTGYKVHQYVQCTYIYIIIYKLYVYTCHTTIHFPNPFTNCTCAVSRVSFASQCNFWWYPSSCKSILQLPATL
jgi:hypothetical protein